jgi:hypothetical protein
MTDKPGTPAVRTMRAQGLVNLVVRGLLCTPGLSRIIGSRLVTLYDGNANYRDLHLAWVGGARVIKLTPR